MSKAVEASTQIFNELPLLRCRQLLVLATLPERVGIIAQLTRGKFALFNSSSELLWVIFLLPGLQVSFLSCQHTLMQPFFQVNQGWLFILLDC